jgi:NAD(P)-dependent dehydrogenase (short-subunit alcohol dehydrogenase family)
MVRTFTGQVAVVTGGGRGIGRAVAYELAQRGARVVVADNGSGPDGRGRDDEVADQVATEIAQAGGTAVAAPVDISDEDESEELIRSTIGRWKQIDVLVNIAGNIRLDSIADSAVPDLEAHLRTHLYGTYFTTRAVASHWMQREYGRLINFSSVAGLNVGFPSLLSYSTAKAAVVGFTRACANFLVSYGVTANCVCPTANTRMGLSIKADAGRATVSADDTADVAPMVAFLASREAGHVTGRVFGAVRGHYALWSEPVEQAAVDQTPGRSTDALEEALADMCADLALGDLPMPADRVGPGWKERHGLLLPRWDGPGEGTSDRSSSADPRSLSIS